MGSSAWVAQLGWQDRWAHIPREQETVTQYQECPCPFSVTEARLKHAMLRTWQLGLDVHFAFPARFVQINGLQIKSLDLYLVVLDKETFAAVKKLCRYCVNICLLSDWLQAISVCCAGPKIVLERPCRKSTGGPGHSTNLAALLSVRLITGLSCTVVLLCQSCELNAVALPAIFGL